MQKRKKITLDSVRAFRLSDDDARRLSEICDETGLSISELVKFRIVELTEKEIEAIKKGRYAIVVGTGKVLIMG